MTYALLMVGGLFAVMAWLILRESRNAKATGEAAATARVVQETQAHAIAILKEQRDGFEHLTPDSFAVVH